MGKRYHETRNHDAEMWRTCFIVPNIYLFVQEKYSRRGEAKRRRREQAKCLRKGSVPYASGIYTRVKAVL